MIVNNLNDFVLKRIIIHNIDKKNNVKVLSDLMVDIDDHLDRLVKAHILKSINDEKRRFADFNAAQSQIKIACSKCLNGTIEEFIDSSKVIANIFYDKLDNRIKSSNILFAKYAYNNDNYLAFLKMDYTENLIIEREEIEDKIRLFIKPIGSGVPNEKHKLQKAFFFKIKDDINSEPGLNNVDNYEKNLEYNEHNVDNFELIIVDNDAKNSDKEIADFFIYKFLNARLIRNDRDITKLFFNTVQKFANDYLYNRIDANELDNFNKKILNSLNNSNSIDINALANDIFSNDEQHKNAFINAFNDSNCELNFNVDLTYVNTFLNKRKYETTTGIIIKIPAAMENNPEKFEKIYHKDGTCDIIIYGEKYKESFSK